MVDAAQFKSGVIGAALAVGERVHEMPDVVKASVAGGLVFIVGLAFVALIAAGIMVGFFAKYYMNNRNMKNLRRDIALSDTILMTSDSDMIELTEMHEIAEDDEEEDAEEFGRRTE